MTPLSMTTSTLPSAAPSRSGMHAMSRLLPSASDRVAWETQLRRLGPVLRHELLQRVTQAKAYEIKPVLASHYHAYMVNGDRLAHEAILHPRRANLTFLAVGAGILGDRDCLGPLEDLIWSTCEETTWVTPAVARGLPSYQPADFEVELTPAMTGLLFASIDHLLEDQLHPHVRERIGQCLLERVVRPFLDKEYWWLNPVPPRRLNNWTSVCAAGALACVTLVPELRSWREAIIDKCIDPLMHYMDTFDAQGGCEEGGSYWVFGVDYLTLAAELLKLDATSPDLYTHPRFKAIAQFPPRIFLGDKQWIPFSDCRQTPRVNASTLAKLDERLDVPKTGALASRCEAHLDFFAKEATLLHTLGWWPDSREGQTSAHASHQPAAMTAEACVYFPGIEWMISRAEPADANTLVLSAHAGHNGYSHNHNDVGHVSVYSRTLPLLVDFGVPVYDRDYFSEKRLTYMVASSLGHSVPQINGQLQLRGEAYASKVLRQSHGRDRDEIVMDLKNVYGREAGLASLTRAVSMIRATHTAQASADVKSLVKVVDDFTFDSDQPNRWQFVSAALTTGRVTTLAPGQLLIENGDARGVFAFDAGLIACTLENYPDVKLNERIVQCTRLCLSLCESSQSGQIAWTITPVI